LRCETNQHWPRYKYTDGLGTSTDGWAHLEERNRPVPFVLTTTISALVVPPTAGGGAADARDARGDSAGAQHHPWTRTAHRDGLDFDLAATHVDFLSLHRRGDCDEDLGGEEGEEDEGRMADKGTSSPSLMPVR
jgi:hypothetical protein